MASFGGAGSNTTPNYANTSLDALCEAAGVNRPSLYAALGDKQSIYLKSVERYNARAVAVLTATLDAQPTLEAALISAYRMALNFYGAGDNIPRGCLGVSVTSVDAALDPEIANAARAMLDETDKAFAARIKRAKKDGDPDAKASPPALGRLAASVLHSLALRVRAGESRDSLIRHSRDMAAAIAGMAKG